MSNDKNELKSANSPELAEDQIVHYRDEQGYEVVYNVTTGILQKFPKLVYAGGGGAAMTIAPEHRI